MKIHLVSKYILPFGYGLTLRNHLLVRKDSKDITYVIAHEETHWRQRKKEAREHGAFVSRLKKLEAYC